MGALMPKNALSIGFIAISSALSVGAAKTATKPMGKRLLEEEVYIEMSDTATDGGGNVACSAQLRRPVAALP